MTYFVFLGVIALLLLEVQRLRRMVYRITFKLASRADLVEARDFAYELSFKEAQAAAECKAHMTRPETDPEEQAWRESEHS